MKKTDNEKLMEEILNYISGKKYIPTDKNGLIEHFSTYYAKEAIEQAIDDLFTDYKVVNISKGKDKFIQSANNLGIFKAEVTGVNDDYFYAHVDGVDDDYKLPRKGYELLFPKSQLLIKIYSYTGKDGEVIKVLNNTQPTLVGEVYAQNTNRNGVTTYNLVCDNKRVHYTVTLPLEEAKKVVDGSIVTYKLEAYKNKAVPRIIEVLGHKDDPDVFDKRILRRHEIDDYVSQGYKDEIKNLPKTLSSKDREGKIDHTKETTLTMDPVGCKDVDDAFSVEVLDKNVKLSDSKIRVRIHIADVSYYVKEGSEIDKRARELGNSYYLAGHSVYPMLPRELSNGICSLNKGEDRLALTFEFTVDPNGEISDYDLYESIINVDEAINYGDALKLLEKEPNMMDKYGKYYNDMLVANEVSKRRRAYLKKRGKLDIDTHEISIIYDKQGHPVDVKANVQTLTEGIIEMLMVTPNEVFVGHARRMGLEMISRNEDFPDIEKLEKDFIPYCQSIAITPRFINENYAYEYERIMSLVKSDVAKNKLSEFFIRCLPKAIYSPDATGHYALGLDNYGHLTAPIRRYCDLTNHRILRKIIALKEHPEYYEELQDVHEELEMLCEELNKCERAADDIEREAQKAYLAEFMSDKIGNQYPVIVSGFTNKGMFAEISNTGIEGFIPFKDLTKDSYAFDNSRKIAIGKRTGDFYRIGDKLMINVIRADKASGQIDFEYIKRLEKTDCQTSEVEDKKKSKKDSKKNKSRGNRH